MSFRFLSPFVLLLAASVVAAPVPDRVPDLVRLLKSGKPGERVIAAEHLGDLGPAAADAIPALLEVIRTIRVPEQDSNPPPSLAQRANGFLYEAASNALTRTGLKAVPALIELLSHESSEVRHHAAMILKGIGPDASLAVPALVKLLADENDQVRRFAADALAAIGPKAEPAIPALVKVLVEQEGPGAPASRIGAIRVAAHALAAIGPKAEPAIKEQVLPKLIGIIKKRGPGAVQQQWEVFGEVAAPLAPILVEYARKHEDTGFASSELLNLGPAGQKAFIEWLTDKNPEVGKKALLTFDHTSFGSLIRKNKPDLTPLVPHLLSFLKDADYKLRLAAVEILVRVKPELPPDAVAGLLALYSDLAFVKFQPESGWESIMTPARQVAGKMIECGLGRHLVPILMKHLQSDDKKLRQFALNNLPTIGGLASPALADLRAITQSDDPNLVRDAAFGAVSISFDPKDAKPLVRLLGHTDANVRLKACQKLDNLGRLATPHLPSLIPLVKDPSREVQAAAIRADAAIDATHPAVKPVIPAIIEGLEDASLAHACRYAVTVMGPGAKEAVPTLIRLLSQAAPNSRLDILTALAAIGPDAKDAVPLVRKLLSESDKLMKDSDVRQCYWSLFCLADIGPGAKAAIPDLQEMLIDPDPMQRLVVAYVLTCIQKDIEPYRAIFLRAMSDPRLLHGRVFAGIAPMCPELASIALDQLRSNLAPYDNGIRLRMIACHASRMPEAIPVLMKLLSDPEFGETTALCETLAAFGPAAKEALPKLRELLDSPHLWKVQAAREAIAKIEAKK